MVSIPTLPRTGPKTSAGLARCRTVRLSHGYYSARSLALRRASRALLRAQRAAVEAVRSGDPDALSRLSDVRRHVVAMIVAASPPDPAHHPRSSDVTSEA